MCTLSPEWDAALRRALYFYLKMLSVPVDLFPVLVLINCKESIPCTCFCIVWSSAVCGLFTPVSFSKKTQHRNRSKSMSFSVTQRYKTNFSSCLPKGILQGGYWIMLTTALFVYCCYLWVFIPVHNMQLSWESKKIIHKVAWMKSSRFSIVLGQMCHTDWGTRARCVEWASEVSCPQQADVWCTPGASLNFVS